MSHIDLPPYGPIPDDVRDRIRRKVQRRIRKPRYRTPVGVAAAVTLLAAGALVITDKPDGPVELAMPTPESVAMDRCWAAIQKSGETGRYPHRDQWRVAVTHASVNSPVTVVGITSDAPPFFCQTTETTVTVSAPTTEPRYAKGTKTAALLFDANGIVAGVMGPGWPAARIYQPPRPPGFVLNEQGMFIYLAATHLDGPVLVKRAERDNRFPEGEPLPDIELPLPQNPAVTVVDRPAPAKDRTSERGAELDQCLAESTSSGLQSAGSFGPGAQVTRDGAVQTMARSETWIASCSLQGVREAGSHTGRFLLGAPLSVINPEVPIGVDTGFLYTGNKPLATLGGTVPARTRRMQIDWDGKATASADIANATFLVIVPDGVPANSRTPPTVQLFDINETMFHSGPLLRYLQPK
ncbi:hypothetical protein LWC34_22405 [Kibdelosporangium philippinense]|uniref:Type VII secretion protein EccB n=1 Tax=Kibdelosporangium philippinense TaxID=211113 RepID=A0ABS8ZCN5_9PSEU|nr:hypothetical protein [Kibdelosporangium philippinense]MCE7005555.1 hypothetical protein [Kibdelosporangium philippinense]